MGTTKHLPSVKQWGKRVSYYKAALGLSLTEKLAS